jgi:hypothetical protein
MPKVITIVKDAFFGVAVYLATLIGILLSQYAPLLLTHARLDTAFDFVRLAISMAVAFYVVASQENGGDEEGKKRNFKKRIANAFSQGVAWNSIMGIAGTAAGLGQ